MDVQHPLLVRLDILDGNQLHVSRQHDEIDAVRLERVDELTRRATDSRLVGVLSGRVDRDLKAAQSAARVRVESSPPGRPGQAGEFLPALRGRPAVLGPDQSCVDRAGRGEVHVAAVRVAPRVALLGLLVLEHDHEPRAPNGQAVPREHLHPPVPPPGRGHEARGRVRSRINDGEVSW